jgi:hypothetical protein
MMVTTEGTEATQEENLDTVQRLRTNPGIEFALPLCCLCDLCG